MIQNLILMLLFTMRHSYTQACLGAILFVKPGTLTSYLVLLSPLGNTKVSTKRLEVQNKTQRNPQPLQNHVVQISPR